MTIKTIITCDICKYEKLPNEVKGFSKTIEGEFLDNEEYSILLTDNWKEKQYHICNRCVEEIKKIVF